MADKLVSQDPTKPGINKVNGPTLTAANQIPLNTLDPTGAVNGNVVVLTGGVWAPGAAGGGDTASNVGAGTGTIFKQKTGSDFEFKTLIAGSGIVIVNGVSDITLSTLGLQPIVIVQDQKAQNTGGGTFTTGAWRTRDINTEVADAGGNCTIAANQITLLAGTYHFQIECPAYLVNGHQARLQNITDATTVQYGMSSYSGTGDSSTNTSVIQGRMVIAASKTFEVQHNCEVTNATIGFGRQGNVAGEIYTTALFTKEA